jgi:hypothetical protein
LKPEQWTHLDQALQVHVLSVLGGLHTACSGSSDLARNVGMPLVEQAATFLSELLPITDVAQVELAEAANLGKEAPLWIEDYLARATPLLTGKDPSRQTSYLLVPGSDAGKTLGEAACREIPALHLIRVPGQAHLLFCREQGFLGVEDLQNNFRHCRDAYQEKAMVPQASPHARFDVMDWMPLDP